MTYGKTIIISLLIGLFIGILATGAIGYITIYGPNVSRLRGELDASRADAQLYLDRANRNEAIIGEVKNELDTTTKQLGSTISTISDAKRKIREIIEALRKIRKMVEDKELTVGG